MKYFFEIDFSHVRGHIVFLDIDGTIASDRIDLVEEKILNKIDELKNKNKVFLLSNNKRKERLENISKNTGLEYIDSLYRKPRRSVLKGLSDVKDKKLFVIGDQVCTDVIFAKRIGAQYIQVKRLLGKQDSVQMKLVYFLDDVAGFFLRIFMKI